MLRSIICHLLLLTAFSAQAQDDKRCATQLECELECPEVSLQGQGKAKDGRETTFCDPVGEEVVWYDDQTKASQGERYGEHQTGSWRFWYKSGTLESHRNFADTGMPHGKQTTWHPNGKKKSEGTFDEGLAHGNFQDWHNNGSKAGARQYKQGNLVGLIQQWHTNGRLLASGQAKGRKIRWERFYSNGKKGAIGSVERSGDMLDLENNHAVGDWVIYFPSGKKQLLARFKRGKADGSFKRWFSSGKPLFEGQFKGGRATGDQKRWFANGQLETLQTFGKEGRGEPHGRFQRFYPSGMKAEQGGYRAGRRHGVWRRWHRNGELAQTSRYKGSNADTQRYDRYGAKLEQGIVQDGRRHGTWTHFDAGGAKRGQGTYRGGIKVGLWRFWGDDEKPVSKGSFDESGRRIGAWRYDHPGGGKQMLVKPIKAKGKGIDQRYLHRGRAIPACAKMAAEGSCHGISFFDKQGRLRVRITLPANWQSAAKKSCSSPRYRTAEHCDADHGDLVHAIDGLARLVTKRRVTHPAECWSAGGESEPCPNLDAKILVYRGLGSVSSRAAKQAQNPFAQCSDQDSCTALCRSWTQSNDPFTNKVQALRRQTELSCSPSGPFIQFHQAKAGIAAVVGARALPHRQALGPELHGPWTRYHASGGMAEQGNYQRGLKNGPWTHWHESGGKAAVVTFENGLEQGATKHWHADGKLAAIGGYKAGVRSGAWRFFDDQGQAVSKGAFRNGHRQGAWLLYDADGKPESKGRYEHSRRIGKWTYFDSKGRKKAICTWKPDGDLDRQDCRRTSGARIQKGALKNDLETGPWVFFHRNGKKRSQGEMKDGERHGVWRFRHLTGSKRAKGRYDRGQAVDQWRCWDENGAVVSCPKKL